MNKDAPMKLVTKYGRDEWRREYSIASAIEYECSSSAEGTVERARDVADNVASKLGALVELLHARGVLSDVDVVSLFGGFEMPPPFAP